MNELNRLIGDDVYRTEKLKDIRYCYSLIGELADIYRKDRKQLDNILRIVYDFEDGQMAVFALKVLQASSTTWLEDVVQSKLFQQVYKQLATDDALRQKWRFRPALPAATKKGWIRLDQVDF